LAHEQQPEILGEYLSKLGTRIAEDIESPDRQLPYDVIVGMFITGVDRRSPTATDYGGVLRNIHVYQTRLGGELKISPKVVLLLIDPDGEHHEIGAWSKGIGERPRYRYT